MSSTGDQRWLRANADIITIMAFTSEQRDEVAAVRRIVERGACATQADAANDVCGRYWPQIGLFPIPRICAVLMTGTGRWPRVKGKFAAARRKAAIRPRLGSVKRPDS